MPGERRLVAEGTEPGQRNATCLIEGFADYAIWYVLCGIAVLFELYLMFLCCTWQASATAVSPLAIDADLAAWTSV